MRHDRLAAGREERPLNTRIAWLVALGAFLAATLAAAPARAVSMDKSSSAKDFCTLRLGSDEIQFAADQPDFSHDKYCEEFPSAGRIIFAFDLVAPGLRDTPIELRILRDPLTPLDEAAELSSLTVAHLPPKVYKTGTFTFEHDFEANGRFIGLVTAISATGERRSAQFKFTVGRTLFSYVPIALGGALILGLLFVYWKHGARRSVTGAAA